MKLKKWKRLCGLLLAAVLVGSSFMQYTGVVRAEGEEPSYNETTCNLLYSSTSLEFKEAGNKSFGVTVPANQTYYVSFTVQSVKTEVAAGEVYFDYRGSNAARLYLGQTQYALLGLDTTDYPTGQLWPQGNFGLSNSNGVKITLRSDSDKTTLWIAGERKNIDIPIATPAEGIPKISWATAGTKFSDIKVWTEKDEPVYNPETDTMKYEATEVTMSQGSKDFGVTIPADTTYFGSFTVKTAGEIYFNYRGTDDNGGRLYLGQTQCGFIGLASVIWPQGDKGLSTTGIKVTFRSDPDKTTIWINGEKLADNAALAEGKMGLVGAPKISWASDTTTITNIAIWKIKDANDEPVYDEMKDKLYAITNVESGCTYDGGVLTVPAKKAAGVKTELPSNAAYYMTMRVKTDNYVNIGTRVGSLIHIEKVGYSFDGTTENTWVSDQKLFAKLATGVKITIYSDTVGFKIWVDGEKAIERTYSTANSSTNPDIPWSFASEVTASDIQIWTLNVAEPAGHTITLDGNIGVNFYMNLGAAINPEEAVMKFTLPDGSTQQVTGVSTDKGYQYTCEVAAKEMTKEIKAQVVAGDAVSKEYTYSVKDYADTILSDEATYAKEIPLVKAMLNYGAYAQTYFGYNTEALANASLEDTEKDVSSVSAETLDSFKKSEQSNTAVALAGARLILESETTLKLYFKLADGADVKDYSFASGGKALTPEKSGTYYYVAITNIDAKNLDTDYTVTVTSEESTLNVTYSPMTYCYNVLMGGYTGNKEDELKNVVKALYLYNFEANKYFQVN